MILKDNITIPALSGDVPRRIYIYLPPEYEQSQEFYPVLYMFDGHNVFFDEDATYGKSWGMKEYLEQENPALIVVAVECNHKGNRRLCEYSPWSFHDKRFGSVEGVGKIYMDWLTGELKPLIDSEFRTIPEREATAICGSSMGGLMTVYAVTAYNHIFSKGAALSPSLWCGPQKILNLIRNTDFDENTILYMDYGSVEMGNHTSTRSTLKRVSGALMDRGVYTCMRIVPGGEHCEASWERQIPIFMNCLDIPGRNVY
ncbi:MAG: alpha/beta hydrolase-fold protein [Lachnospiraceae bacterium]|nr:alpha/beta hydrolase-fold protein [Lachnospiraceae bacterium]